MFSVTTGTRNMCVRCKPFVCDSKYVCLRFGHLQTLPRYTGQCHLEHWRDAKLEAHGRVSIVGILDNDD
jgi:hypothetical protein